MSGLGQLLPADSAMRTEHLSAGTRPYFRALDVSLGTSARDAATLGKGPVVALGILDRAGEARRLGGGIYDMPVAPFEDAVKALEHGRRS